ncbi:MAG: hypothetical protein PF447_00990 [Spirochaetaceae bacterium]|nr:hypothetical protein [Spirochaetaceae bacterium]
MKKILFILSLLAIMASFTLTAETRESEFYSVDLMVVSVAPHPLGYKVVYYDKYAQLHDLYIPLEWFQSNPAGIAQIVYGAEKTYPYLTLYYKNAVLDHLRLYVFSNQNDPTWSTLSRQMDLSDEFDVTLETMKIEF